MTEHAVVIAGGGPTGLMLGGELALARADVVIVERRETQELEGSRAGGLHARTIEVLDQRGIAERFLAQGRQIQIASFGQVPLDISDFPTRHNYGLGLWQSRIERILADWVEELGVPIQRGREVTGFAQDATGVDVEISDGRTLRAGYLVGCDGGRSLIRKSAGIEFPGWDPSISYLIAEVEMAGDPPLGFRRDEKGTHAMGRLEDGRVRVVLREEHVRHGEEPTLGDLRDLLVTLYRSDFGLRRATYLSRFRPWADRVRWIEARHPGAWELPVLGRVSAPSAVLVRPDGHVAWVGEGTDRGLGEALATWFGAPRAPSSSA